MHQHLYAHYHGTNGKCFHILLYFVPLNFSTNNLCYSKKLNNNYTWLQFFLKTVCSQSILLISFQYKNIGSHMRMVTSLCYCKAFSTNSFHATGICLASFHDAMKYFFVYILVDVF